MSGQLSQKDIGLASSIADNEDALPELPVDLGFVQSWIDSDDKQGVQISQECSFLLGQPIYLANNVRPQKGLLKCGSCGKDLRFLLQLFCPGSEANAYDRILYVYYCLNGKCYIQAGWSKCVRVFRSQQSEKEHESCPLFERVASENEYEIFCEPEPSQLQLQVDNPRTIQNQIEQDLDEQYENTNADRAFLKFQKRLSRAPLQVLRYLRSEEASENFKLIENSDRLGHYFKNPALKINNRDLPIAVAKCGCGSDRSLEMQILPTILTYIDTDPTNDSVDWGILDIYTCINNCNLANSACYEELVWLQTISI